MKKLLKKLADRLMVLFLLSVMLFSCKKEEIDNKDLFAYVPAGPTAYNELSESVTIISGKVISKMNTGFPALLTRSTNLNVEVSAKIDTTLIASYNKANRTSYPLLPIGLFSLEKDSKVTVLKDQTQSADSIKVHILDASKLTAGDNNFLIPVVLNMANSGVSVSNTRQVMFVKLNLKVAALSIADISGNNYTDIRLGRSGNTTTGIATINLKGILNIEVDRDVSLSITANTSLVEDFNKKNNKNYKPFPIGSYSLTKDNTVIPAKQTTSGDNLQVKLNDYDLFLTGEEYLLPVQIKDNTSVGNLPVDLKKNVVYIHLSIFPNNVDPSNSFLGAIVADRTGWSATASGNYYSYIASNMLDGDNSTSWHSDKLSPDTVQIDTKRMNSFKGISFVPSYAYISNSILNMDVATSDDGIIWKIEGEYVGTDNDINSTAINPDIKYIRFITPVSARYFRLIIKKTTFGSFAGMAEFNLIE